MATLVRETKTTLTDHQWKQLRLKFHRGDIQGALGAAAQRARMMKQSRIVFATRAGYQIVAAVPLLPPGHRYWVVTVDGDTIHGKLYEV